MVRTRANSVNSDPCCPICLEGLKFAVETNCGHLYCGDCILEIRRNEPSASPISCPSCRQDVTVLLACFTILEVEAAAMEQEEERNRILREIKGYNRIYCQHPRSKSNEAALQPRQQQQQQPQQQRQQPQQQRQQPQQQRQQPQQQRQQPQQQTVQVNSTDTVTGAAVVVGVGAVLIAGVIASLGVGLARLAFGSARSRRD